MVDDCAKRKQSWDDFVAWEPCAGFMQSSWWSDFMVSAGWDHFGMVLRDRGTIVGGATIWRWAYDAESCFYFVPEGPVLMQADSIADQAQAFQAFMDFIDEKRRHDSSVVSHLRIEPPWESLPTFVHGFREVGEYFHVPRDTLLIDLTHSDTDILAQMKPKGRYNVAVARKHGVVIVEDASEQGVIDFCEMQTEMCERKGIKGQGSDYYQRLIPLLARTGQGGVYFAEYQGIRLAAAVVIIFGNVATYLYGASRATQRNVMAPYLLHFHIMREAKARGCEIYDLFGISPRHEAESGWTSFSEFKRKLGGREMSWVPSLDHVYDSLAYARYRESLQAEQDASVGLLSDSALQDKAST
ncbi:lipid II:glycine glycyltransferase FemX [Methylotetracoccus oryzae]|uniref:lipid II:glycine glycyltransferase FemX n=1 Tax=Methylotetracoccus oryzae TaxID=1919059 RepID=UPI0013A53BC6|nr:peptidoglycan bridge formation glycyltransferase FemA/FemB family protein [Methylotetracoccus oryzae]